MFTVDKPLRQWVQMSLFMAGLLGSALISAQTNRELVQVHTSSLFSLQITAIDQQVLSEENSDEIPMNLIHSWTLKVTDKQGAAVEGKHIKIRGGMEAHGHALPTQPQIVPSDAPGEYRINGLKFQMPGEWFLSFDIPHDTNSTATGAGQKAAVDSFRLDFEVLP